MGEFKVLTDELSVVILLTITASSLTSGSCLLLAGSIADVVGCRPIYLAGCFLTGCFVLGSGLARTGIELTAND
jgi:MFS family permease